MVKKTEKGTEGPASYQVDTVEDGEVTVRVWRDYPSALSPSTAVWVWQTVSDFGGIKTIFPSLLSVYLTYPDATDAKLNVVRHMVFAPPDPTQPLSLTNALPTGIEQLVDLDNARRRLTYTSSFGLPVTAYRSTMEVVGADDCRLNWTSTFRPIPGAEGISRVIAIILANGANQIATALKLQCE